MKSATTHARMRVVLADDQELLRHGLRGLLQLADEVEVVGEASDGIEAVDVVRARRPDVLLLDVRMPKLDGVGVLRALGADAPPTVMLTTFDDPVASKAAAEAGARAFLLKDVSLETLVDVLRRVREGATLLPRATKELDALTPREREILELISQGLTNQEIADELVIELGTVKNHVHNVLNKLHVNSRKDAALYLSLWQDGDDVDTDEKSGAWE